MKPKQLIISGWGPYKNKIRIDFEAFDGKGIFLVTGATGAGKTTIFDAISYALYGRLSGEVREKSSVRSDFAEPDTPTFVELFMEHAGKAYHIVRNPEYTRPKKRSKTGSVTKEKENAILYFEDGTVLEGTKEVNARVQEILVLDYEQFKQITMIAQGEFARLLTASPKEKTAIFRDIFGTGIYENFTRVLKERAKDLYGDVQEQKYKLEEDIRLLLADGMHFTKGLAELTDTEYWNYDAVAEELKNISQATQKEEKRLEKESKGLQEKRDALTADITEKEMWNQQIEQLETAQSKLQILESRKEEMLKKSRSLLRARTATTMEPYRIKAQIAKKRLIEKKEELVKCQARKKDLLAEQSGLCFVVEMQEVIQEYLEAKRLFEENDLARKDAEIKYIQYSSEWEKAKDAFQKAEKWRDGKRQIYEEAEKQYRYAAVGIAAKMLKAGEPCPVCGSKEHPYPAKAGAEVLSEEELKTLKAELAEAENRLTDCQERAVMVRTRTEEQERSLEQLKDCVALLQAKLEEYQSTLQKEESFVRDNFFLEPYQMQQTIWQKKVQRFSQLKALLQSEENLLLQISEEIGMAEQDAHNCDEELQNALKQEGFESEEACEEALLPKDIMLQIEQEWSLYESEMTSAKGIIVHLEETVKDKKRYDMEELYSLAKEYKEKLVQVQSESKPVSSFCREIKKTISRFQEGQKRMAKAREEYGCVGELANLASGNNAKRLVFEQYVLAGYFEEILRAANLRFYKMTGGRYEMSRIQEAGDGRTKDSLEIQVMDYYTGKQRPVKTLSGGESFKAALSLALGMSDVIQAMSGGIKVDTLFIDEGFGALDAESLDQACETLMGLVEHDRLIGIISHVPELRERIDNQLVIEKTNSGSHVEIRV